MALDYDFFITPATGSALGFNFYITKDKPYERATAQFRKDQVDQSGKVGDQSLTGWWTRGQLSFHKGAGENYYEVTDGETVLNRYKDSNAVEVFEPGEVTLSKSLGNMSIAATDAVPAPLSKGGGVYALTATNVKYTAGADSITLPTSNGGAPSSIATSGTSYYVANGVLIERQFADGVGVRTNHVTEPSFETSAGTWGSTLGAAFDTSVHKYGAQSLLVPGSDLQNSAQVTVSGLTVGQTYVISAWVYVHSALSGGANPGASLWVDGVQKATTTNVLDTWVRLSGTHTATATSHLLKVNGERTSGYYPSINIDAVMVTEAPFSSDYFDGSYPGCSWAGTPNASKSTYTTSSAVASEVRVTLTGSTWSKVWWAKGRLWAVDNAGYFYAVADSVATVSNTAAFWNSGRTGVSWSLTDSPGPVYIADGSNIYAVTVGTDGLVPSLTSPTTVAQLPAGETISRIAYYLGNLIVATSAGVRIAAIQNNQVFLGPLVIEGDFSGAGRMGLWDTRVYMVGRPSGRGGDYVLCSLDLSQQVSDLVPAWAPVQTVSTLASTASGATVDATGCVYAWAAGALYGASRDVLTASGYVKTAYHRFGTLDGKNFSSVLVRTAGTGGTVQVSRVDADGTETALTTITMPTTGPTSVDLGVTSPVERIALKFTLTRATDTTKGPTLLGYQLRALPAPKRQRMIRVPLMLFDKETNRNGQHVGGDAQARRAALEALEESNAVVTFKDNVHGETGTAFIEAVEVSEVAAAGRENPGGLLYVTLRKLA